MEEPFELKVEQEPGIRPDLLSKDKEALNGNGCGYCGVDQLDLGILPPLALIDEEVDEGGGGLASAMVNQTGLGESGKRRDEKS